MTATTFDGRAMAREIQDQLALEVKRLVEAGIRPHLVALETTDDPAGRLYLRNQSKRCEEIGIRYSVKSISTTAGEEALLGHVQSLNYNPEVTGILVQLPLPEGYDARRVQGAIRPDKDVEGMNPENLGRLYTGRQVTTPCTALAALEVLRRTGTPIRGSRVTVVGHSDIVGKPLLVLLVNEMATVTVCHAATVDLPHHTREADIVIVAVGRPGLLTADMVRPGAVVIDVGINRIEVTDGEGGARTETTGDVDAAGVAEVASLLTPVPGGVGPITVAMLLANTVACARRQLESRDPSS